MSRCYAYKIAPIDVGFDHLVSVDDYILYLARYEVNRLLDFISSWDFAKNLAIDAGWEGDIREGPFVFFLPFPDSSEMSFAFIFKQDNNGDTMVVSPVSWNGYLNPAIVKSLQMNAYILQRSKRK